MGKLTLSSFQQNNTTTVSNIFVDKYMGDANGEFVKVYLYLLRCMNGSCAGTDTSLSDIADRLNLTEKDIVRALKYWDKSGVLNVVFGSEKSEPTSITVLSLESDNYAAATVALPAEDIMTPDEPKVPSPKSYSPAQLKRLSEQEDIQQLLYIVEKYIGKPLTTSEINKVLYFQESLNFSPELIEYLVEYCVSNNHTSLRYMEKVALSWFEQGITTVGDAKNASSLYSSNTLPVIKAFGLDHKLTPIELDYVNRWHDEYGFDNTIITEACQQTILSLGKPNFRYADRILSKWKSANVHTMEDIKKLNDGFRGKITVPVGTRPASAPPKTNRFNNFSQRTYDFDAIEKQLIGGNK